jgi:hypothetical protein
MAIYNHFIQEIQLSIIVGKKSFKFRGELLSLKRNFFRKLFGRKEDLQNRPQHGRRRLRLFTETERCSRRNLQVPDVVVERAPKPDRAGDG